MPNQFVQLTSPQRLAQALQSMDQNAVMPMQTLPQTAGGGGMQMPGLDQLMKLKGLFGKPSNPMDAQQTQMANDREAEDMSWGQ